MALKLINNQQNVGAAVTVLLTHAFASGEFAEDRSVAKDIQRKHRRAQRKHNGDVEQTEGTKGMFVSTSTSSRLWRSTYWHCCTLCCS